ncbi:hypothetical protein B0H17DRAFT_1145583 [Mycena rosella]|uniref:Fungal N-terminal domain-containing protein n=1 Tax=Mycena rosella TaxID=1033263 RepID=A0AAD7CQK4_MYCRO|nr:hypothetical protein B0H17DRAFT_1145583 [Mycena rosella]
MSIQALRLLKFVCIRLCMSPTGSLTPGNSGSESQKLAILIQGLKFAEKAAEASGIPYLKGTVALALEIAECVEASRVAAILFWLVSLSQGYRSNDKELDRLVMSCGQLVKDIVDTVKSGGDLSASMQKLVEDLSGTLEKIGKTAEEIVNSGSRVCRWLSQKDNADKLNMLSREVNEAQTKFVTLSLIVNSQDTIRAQDEIYGVGSIALDEHYASGEGWIAFNGKLHQEEENLIVKRYIDADPSTRKAMHEADIKAFKQNCGGPSYYSHRHSNLLQFKGRSHPGAERPYNLLRGEQPPRSSNIVPSLVEGSDVPNYPLYLEGEIPWVSPSN